MVNEFIETEDTIEVNIPSQSKIGGTLDFYYQYIGYKVQLAHIRHNDKKIVVKLEDE